MSDDIGSTGARIQFAIDNRRLIQVHYSGAIRIAKPHDYGIQQRPVLDDTSGSSRGHSSSDHLQWEVVYARVK